MCRTVLLYCFSLFAPGLFGQQDPMFTKYVFNSLIFNPATAGSNDHLTLGLIHRQQWLGFEGAPTTQSLTAHTPLRNEKVGVGFSLVNDRAGAARSFEANAAYAYRFALGSRLRLSVGLQAGVANLRGDWASLTIEQQGDAAFQENLNRWLPNFGAGAYLTGERFYAGIGCPRLLEYKLRKADDNDLQSYARTYRHYYFTAGVAFPLRGDNLVFRPSLLLKSTGLLSALRQDARFQNVGAPTEVDVDASLFILQTFWVGAAYRTALEGRKSSHDSIDFWAAWHLRNGLRFGAAYDLLLSDLRRAGNGSFEVMLGYEFDFKIKKAASPRFF